MIYICIVVKKTLIFRNWYWNTLIRRTSRKSNIIYGADMISIIISLVHIAISQSESIDDDLILIINLIYQSIKFILFTFRNLN